MGQLTAECANMDCIEISAADNGFVLRYKDPEIVKRNAESDRGWQDPHRSRVYPDPQTLADDLTKLLPLMKEYSEERDESAEYRDALNEAFNRK